MPENPFATYNSNLQTRKSATSAIIAQKSTAIDNITRDMYFMVDTMDKNKTRTFIHVLEKNHDNIITAVVIKNKYDQSGKNILSSEQSYTENLNQTVFWSGGSISVSDDTEFRAAAIDWCNTFAPSKI